MDPRGTVFILNGIGVRDRFYVFMTILLSSSVAFGAYSAASPQMDIQVIYSEQLLLEKINSQYMLPRCGEALVAGLL